jgi:hypothetical protein
VLRRVSDRITELEDERSRKFADLRVLEEARPVSVGNSTRLLRCLPYVDRGFSLDDSECARRLLEAFKLVVAYDKVADEARIQITVDARDVDSIRHVITLVVGAPNRSLFGPARAARGFVAWASALDSHPPGD